MHINPKKTAHLSVHPKKKTLVSTRPTRVLIIIWCVTSRSDLFGNTEVAHV